MMRICLITVDFPDSPAPAQSQFPGVFKAGGLTKQEYLDGFLVHLLVLPQLFFDFCSLHNGILLARVLV